MLYIPSLHNRWLTKTVKAALAERISQAERGHRGEIYLVIENHLPITSAYHQDCRARALDLFAAQRVWDTEANTGVLVYVNLCEHDLEIIADRGIDKKAHAGAWRALCDDALASFKADQMQSGLEHLIHAIGELLREHYPDDDNAGNELPNTVVYLR